MGPVRRVFAPLLAFALAAGCHRGSDAGKRQVVAVLPEAPGLRVGDRVEYRGLTVGSVSGLEIPDGRVHLTLTLTREDVPLRATDRIRVVADGVFGASYVEILAPDFGTKPLARRRGMPDTLEASPYAPPDTTLARLAKQALDSLRRASEPRHR